MNARKRCPYCGQSPEEKDRAEGDNRTLSARLAAAEIMLADARRQLATELSKKEPRPAGQDPDEEDKRFKLLELD